MHRTVILAAAAVIPLAPIPPAAAETIRLASWNMNNLHHVVGESLRPGAPARSEADHALLREYRDRLDAGVVALQEVNGPKAAALVFPATGWKLLFDGRYVDDLISGRDSDQIYTDFAVRRGVFDAVSKRDLRELGVIHTPDNWSTRWGTELLVEKGDA